MIRRLGMWWHWDVLGHKSGTGSQYGDREGRGYFTYVCRCGKRWGWTDD